MSRIKNNLENFLALSHCARVGPITFKKYLASDPCLDKLPADLKPDWQGVQRDLTWLDTQTDAHIITIADAAYPPLLKNIVTAPPVLYVQGDVTCLQNKQLAIVGSRGASAQGMAQAEYFARQLVNFDFTITSGLAVGIDAAAHLAAIRNNGKTVAVLAHGIDKIYPAKHASLAQQICSHGCLVTEFPIGCAANSGFFPRRNRIISGLCLGVLVVEAALNSGSLVTAKHAIEQGREVFAIPGAIYADKKQGCHELIKAGAKLVCNINDILEELLGLLKYDISDKNAGGTRALLPKANLSREQQILLDTIAHDVVSTDAIILRTEMSTSKVSAILLDLELQDLVIAVPGGYARKLG